MNWVLKIFLSKMPKLKLYAQNMIMNKFFKCVLMIDNKCKNNKCKESRDREKQTQKFVIDVRLIVYVSALNTMT